MLIYTPEQVTPEWLTERLIRQGILQRGVIIQIRIAEQSFQKGTFGNTASLEVVYSEDTNGPVPRHFFLKVSKSDLPPETLAFGEREVAFYDAMRGRSLPIPRCYDGAYNAGSGHSHLLIDDLSPTHYHTAFPLPPSPQHCEMIVKSLAQLHAQCWNSVQLSRDLGHLCANITATATRLRLEVTLPGFLEFLGDTLLPAQQRVYQDILTSSLLERREERRQRMVAVTITHGDAHPWNFMLPRATEAGQVMVIDWHLWEINVPTNDLAYFMAFWWGPGRRATLERPLVETYHRQLLDYGVENYDWAACWRDYRESVAYTTLIPIGQFRRKVNLSTLWSGVENSTAAFQDLTCTDLL